MTATINDPTTERLERIPLDQLHASPDNPRAVGDVAELAASITEHGVVEPLVVVPRAEGGYTVVAGHRRLAASALAGGITDAPCIVRQDLDDDQAAELRLVENLHRRDLSPLEEAAGYQALVDRGYSQRKLARQVGKSQPHISRRLSLLRLPAKAIDALDAGSITVEQATTLARLPKDTTAALFKGGVPAEWKIKETVLAHEREERRAAMKQELAKQGVTLVEGHPPAGYQHGIGNTWGHLASIDAEAHAGEPCHAAYVTLHGQVELYCTDPDRHQGGDSALQVADDEEDFDPAPADPAERERWEARAAEHKARRAAEEERAGRREAIDTRRAYVAGVVADLDAAGAVELTALLYAHCFYVEDPFDRAVAEQLGIAPDTFTGATAAEQVAAYAAKGTRNRTRAVATAAAVLLEAMVTPSQYRLAAERCGLVNDEDETAARAWFAWLAEHGYKLSDHDRELVPAPEPPSEEPPAGTVAWYDDPDDGARWVNAGEADAIEALDASRLHRLAPEDLPAETAAADGSIPGGWSATVEKPSRSKKWKWSCTCGEGGTKTTEEYAREMGDLHLSEKHGLVAEEATS